MIETALTDDRHVASKMITWVLIFTPLVALFLASRISTAVLAVMRSDVVGTVVAIAALVVGVGLVLVLHPILARSRIALLRRIGHGFEPAKYLELLGQNRSHGTLVVTLKFARPWQTELRAPTIDAVRHWAPELAHVRWLDDSALELTSAELDTIRTVMGGDVEVSDTTYFTNRPLHDCFLHVVKRVLPRLDAATPVEHILVDIRGVVLPWDAIAE